MSNQSLDLRISIEDAINFIVHNGASNPPLFRGEKGIGKSAMLHQAVERLGDEYQPVYLDMAAMSEASEMFIPYPDEDERTFERFVAKHIKLKPGKKYRVIMFDEVTKANRMCMQAIHPALEVGTKRRWGDEFLQPEDRVFGTGNLDVEGIGDNLPDHTSDRFTVFEIKKADAQSWMLWGAGAGIAPEVMTWAHETPDLFASFRDAGFNEENAFVYNPKRAHSGKYVTLRGLELTSNIVKQRGHYSTHLLEAAVAGQIGLAASLSLSTYIKFADELPPRNDIITDPDNAMVPESNGAQLTLVFNLLQAVDKDTINPIMKYIQRLPTEQQSIFCLNLAKDVSRNAIAFNNAAFTAWARENQDIL